MAGTTTSLSAILAPETVDALLVRPAFEASIAAQVTRIVTISGPSFRVPVVTADPTAAWVNEGQEINPSDVTLDEVEVTPRKLAGLSIITRELAEDSSPEAASVVGDGLARDIARKLDAALFSSAASPAPAGLTSLTGGAGASPVSAPSAWANTDPFEAAHAAAADVGATLNAWVTSPADALALAQVKTAAGSNIALLQPDPTAPTRRTIAGLPVFTSPSVAAGTVWGIPRDRVLLVVRDDSKVESDSSVFFTSDRIALKATMRCTFAFPHPAAVVRITRTAP